MIRSQAVALFRSIRQFLHAVGAANETRPPLPQSIRRIWASVYCPLKQSFTNCPAGRVPDRSGEKAPSPSNALFTSITRPPR